VTVFIPFEFAEKLPKHLFNKLPIIPYGLQYIEWKLARDGGSSAKNNPMDHYHYLANYEIEQEIGQGSFATVFLGHEKVILMTRII
jgi:hypothetical protein